MKGAASSVVASLIAAAAIGAQGVRPDTVSHASDASRSIQAQPGTSSAMAAVLARSCGDCHSNTMVSRWYTKVPPFSAIMTRGYRSDLFRLANYREYNRDGHSAAAGEAMNTFT